MAKRKVSWINIQEEKWWGRAMKNQTTVDRMIKKSTRLYFDKYVNCLVVPKMMNRVFKANNSKKITG